MTKKVMELVKTLPTSIVESGKSAVKSIASKQKNCTVQFYRRLAYGREDLKLTGAQAKAVEALVGKPSINIGDIRALQALGLEIEEVLPPGLTKIEL
jgi:hypothetical protein